ncbi:hypothetical protein GQ53DRAFT_814305 [Thozetella sp. PMI_491]|nr:hypothetical protein GQ53DRAFT_814305 [Thozetella sp. PMI_491]
MSVRPGPLQVHDPDVIDVGERYPLNLAQQLVKTDKSLQPARESPLAIRNAASATTGAVDKLAGGDSADTTSRKRRIQDPPSPSRRRISGEAKAPSRALKHIQTIYSHDSPKDVTVRLELPINEDLDLELEEFARLGRTGDFKAAQDFFQHHLGEQLANPYIFIQYATILFEMGDLKRFTSLNADLALGSDLTRPVIGERGGDTRNEDDDDDGLEFVGSRSPPTTISRLDYGNLAPEHDELQLLGWNWRLLNALAQFNLNESIDKLSFGQDLGSTEVQIVSLVMRIYGQVKSCVPDLFTSQTEQLLVNWVDFSGLYQSLLSQGRVWDFRDLVCAAFSVFGPQHWEKLTGDKAMESILGDFAYDMDESTCLALLDILASTTVDPALTPGILSDGTKLSIPTAQSLAESIIASYPKSMRSRPFMRWILTQTLDPGGGDDAKVPDSSQELVRHLETLPGAPFTRKHVQRDWITLPVYVPKDSEIPRWEVPDVPKEAVEPVRLVLNLANELDDYSTQALCYKLLILRSQDPTPLFKELIHLQKTIQGDRYGLLQTCLSSYIGSTDRAAQVNLLDELAEFGDWVGSTEIHDPEMYWARDFIRLALTRAVGRPSNPSSLQLSPSEMHYYMWLPENARDFTRKALAIKEWPTRVSKAIASSVSKDEPQGVTPSKRTRVISTFSSEDDMISGDDESETKGEKWDVENERKVENERLERARKDLERLRRANVRASLERAREEKMGEWERQFRDELELKEAKRELEKIKEEDARRVMENRIRKDIEIEMLAEREREERTRKEHKYLKEAAIAEWKAKEEERAEKERKERESDDRDYLRRVEEDLFASGLERQDIERIFWKMSNAPRSRPLWTRMSLEHLEVDTLKHYGFEFVYDSNPAFVFVKRWVPQWERRSLWEHSRILRDIREGKKTSDERNGREGVMHDPHSQSMPNAEDASDVDETSPTMHIICLSTTLKRQSHRRRLQLLTSREIVLAVMYVDRPSMLERIGRLKKNSKSKAYTKINYP